MGVWLHGLRINRRAGQLDPAKEAQLNGLIPGWRQGRSKGRRGSRQCHLPLLGSAAWMSSR